MRGGRRATRTRRARRAYIARGSHRRSSAGTSRAAVVLSFSSSSLVPSPAIVLVSRFLFGRRSVPSEGAAQGGRWTTRAQRARRAYITGGSHRRSSAETSRAAVVLSSSSCCLVSRPVCRSARAPLLHSTRAPAGGARTTCGCADARRARRDGRGAWGARARRALFVAPSPLLPAPRAPLSSYARSGERLLRASARRTRRATRAMRPARGVPARCTLNI